MAASGPGKPTDTEATTEQIPYPADEPRSRAADDTSFDALLRQVARGTQLSRARRDEAPLRAAAKLHSGRFEIRGALGRGGMGTVYEAFDNERQGLVALKVVGRSVHAEPGTGDAQPSPATPRSHVGASGAYRFKQEFRSLADVVHPNLVRLHELFTVGDPWFFTMDLVTGCDFVEATRGPEALRVSLRDALRQLVDGVSAIHAAGKLHCDLKPGNVLVTPGGRVVILDFGLVTDAEDGGVGRTLDDGVIAGTPAYMAPEQVSGARPSPASDVYAMGVMLFEALTGKLPFSGGTPAQLVQKLEAVVPRPSSFAADVPADLERLCLRMCERDPAARPPCSEIRAALGPGPVAEHTSRASEAPARPASLVGRERELTVLRNAYEQARAGEATVVLVSGESGIGKTALVSAFLLEVQAQSRAVTLTGRCYERESIPYKAFDALVDDLTRYLRRCGDAAMGLLPRDVSVLARLFPVLDRVPVIASAPERPVAGSQQQQLRAFAALEELLGRIRDRQPLVLSIDDLQWADQDSATLLAYLSARQGAGAWLWILDYRSEERGKNPVLDRIIDTLTTSKNLRSVSLPLGPLSTDASEELARSLEAGSTRSRAEIVAVARESGGIPLFVAELVRHVQTRGEIEPGAASLSAALQSRIEHLDAAQRDLLEVVAVASRPLQRGVLLEASQGGDEAHRALDLLLLGHLLRVSGSDAERRIETYHDRIRETVTVQLSAARLREIHRRIVAALSRSREAEPEHLTLHLEGAGEYAQAAEQAVLAAERASQVLAFERAARLYAHAIELGTFDSQRTRALTIRFADALSNAGRSHEAAMTYLRAVAGADQSEVQDLRRRAAEELMISGRAEQGLEVMSTMLAELGLAPMRGGVRSLVSLLSQRALLRARGLDYRPRRRDSIDPLQLRRLDVYWACARGLTLIDQIQGADFATRYLRLALNTGDEGSVGRGLALESAYRANFDEQAAADALMLRAREIAAGSGDPFLTAWVTHFSAVNAFQRCDYAAAIEGLTSALSVYREHCPGAIWESTSARSFLGWSLWNKGEYKRLRELLLAAVQDAGDRGDLLASVTMSTGVFGSAWLIRDEVDEVVRNHALARETWPSIIYDLQRALTLLGETLLDFYRGNDRDAWPRFDAEWPELRNAPIMRNHIARAQLLYARTGCALVAARASAAANRSPLMAAARSSAKQLERIRHPVSRGYAGIAAAGLACAEGDAGRAASALCQAIEAFDAQGSSMLAAAARARLAALSEGEARQRLTEQVHAFMQAQEVHKPERIIAMLTPACELAPR